MNRFSLLLFAATTAVVCITPGQSGTASAQGLNGPSVQSNGYFGGLSNQLLEQSGHPGREIPSGDVQIRVPTQRLRPSLGGYPYGYGALGHGYGYGYPGGFGYGVPGGFGYGYGGGLGYDYRPYSYGGYRPVAPLYGNPGFKLPYGY